MFSCLPFVIVVIHQQQQEQQEQQQRSNDNQYISLRYRVAPDAASRSRASSQRRRYNEQQEQQRPRSVLDFGYQQRPLAIGIYFDTSDSLIGVERLHPYLQRRLTSNFIRIDATDLHARMHLLNSEDYYDGKADEFEHDNCVAQYEWQLSLFTTCNSVHEVDLTNFRTTTQQTGRKAEQVRLVGGGYWRDVWMVKDYSGRDKHALKTLRYKHSWEERNYDRHRRDAVATERLTKSPAIVDIFAFCGNSGVFEYAANGDIEDMLWYSDRKWNSTERLVVAYQVADALADVHNSEKEGVAAVAHTDITTSQFLFLDGRYKLNDFNRCRFISWNNETDSPCAFYVGNNPGTFRSPEEYEYDFLTEKVDVYSMGNVFYSILTERWPFQDEEGGVGQEKVKKGERPAMPDEIQNTSDPALQALMRAARLCWKHDPILRPTSREIAEILQADLRRLGVAET